MFYDKNKALLVDFMINQMFSLSNFTLQLCLIEEKKEQREKKIEIKLSFIR